MRKNGDLSQMHIKDNCYLLVILSQGSMSFEVGDKTISVSAPSFLCFNELEDPVFKSCRDARYVCIYFHPKFLNINMTFELLRSRAYSDIATTYDMFMLKPFLNNEYVVPIGQSQLERIEYCADGMIEELENQRDWYWSCRGRSYFMEIIIMLKRMYGIVGYGFEIEE